MIGVCDPEPCIGMSIIIFIDGVILFHLRMD